LKEDWTGIKTMTLSFKKIGAVAGSIIVIATAIGLLFYLDAYVAKAKDVEQLEIRLDQKILQDRIDFLQAQIWKIEDRYGCQLLLIGINSL
jgi:hypothetical protein